VLKRVSAVMVAPWVVVPVILAKKVAVFYAAKTYGKQDGGRFPTAAVIYVVFCVMKGFPRVYRRLVEGMKILNIPKSQQVTIKSGIKLAMRQPTQALNVIARPEIKEFAEAYSQYSKKAAEIPDFMVKLSLEMVKQSESLLGRTIRETNGVISKILDPFRKS
jgi:hypothetical protein